MRLATSDNIAQFFVTERDAMTFPVASVTPGYMRYAEPTLVMTAAVEGIADVLRQIGTMRDRRSLP